MPTVRVNLGRRSYPVVVASGATETLSELLGKRLERGGRVFVVFDAQVYALHGPAIYRAVKKVSRTAPVLSLPPGERTKSASTIARLHDYFISEGISRDDFILACGGGVLSDAVGFAASTVLRGVRWGVVSTTLLGMVDAAIGGKTGINHKAGKNLIGVFWQPSFVICDLNHLHTLPDRQVVAGMGEVVKYAGLVGQSMFAGLEKTLAYEHVLESKSLGRLIADSVRYKAEIVASDETERGRRMVLNLGHTFAHGIEHAAGYGRMLHGEAVLIGLLAACDLSVRAGISSETKLARYCSIVEQYVRHIRYRRLDPARVWDGMRVDKKRRGAQMRFVLLSAPGRPFISDAVSVRDARAALSTALGRWRA